MLRFLTAMACSLWAHVFFRSDASDLDFPRQHSRDRLWVEEVVLHATASATLPVVDGRAGKAPSHLAEQIGGGERTSLMKKPLLYGLLFGVVFTLYCALSQAQYLSSEQAKNQKEEQERQETDREANSYVGKTYWYIPKPNAISRVEFFAEIPSITNEREVQFFPTSTTSFVVAEIEIRYTDATFDKYYPLEKYYLKIRFPDDKTGYLKLNEIKTKLYDGRNFDFEEYIFTKPPQTMFADQRKSSAGGKAKMAPRIGMTREQVLASNWGKPNKINKAGTAPGAREQWVYSSGYLYLEKGVLVAIDK